MRADHLVVQGFAHAVQTLVFEVFAFTHLVDCAQSVGVVGGKLWEHGILRIQEFACAGEVGDVGVDFTGVSRIAFHAVYLSPFHFAVPVCAFNQTDHQFLVVAAGQVNQIVDNERTTFLVGLNNETDTFVAGQVRIGNQSFHQVQRQFETVGFFGIDVDTDIVFFTQKEQFFQARQQFAHHAFVLGA